MLEILSSIISYFLERSQYGNTFRIFSAVRVVAEFSKIFFLFGDK